MEDTYLAAVERLTSEEWRAGVGGWQRPGPRIDGPNRGDRVWEMAPLHLEFMQAPMPHFH